MVAKAAPPIAVIGAQFAGFDIPNAIQVLTLIYVVLMLVHKIWQMGREAYRFWVLNRDE